MRLAVAVLVGVLRVTAPAARAGVPTDEYTPLTVAVAGLLIPFTDLAIIAFPPAR